LHGGPLSLDIAKKGNMIAFGTQDGELTLCAAEGYLKDGSQEHEYDEFEGSMGRIK
jgi:hypothetical protein